MKEQMLIIFLMFFCGVFNFCMKRKHLLMMLLSLEFIVLVLFFMIYIYLMNYNYEFYFSMIFISLSVCESVLGLSLLVSLIRSYGSDYFYMFNILW
uniref:NADH-ubiquinone oxidoreductase chain 4L n=1 Tax=Nephus voeltzkowi TaxID=2233631 RepID=A0A6M3WEE9_9CUCU|nr:NADH dehydrogenase subunit 4L [Nephus voeltzkowi]QJF72908.1 NADH dehydrogenase subunit 4L [Nephus voeltzkowi]QJF72921.1 NADH dehydrogenase subunit 4L [Nephus voeltzkowi]QJF72934.1 NADH dehydrogenase subunit 4L [Nephus voeltzkowi]